MPVKVLIVDDHPSFRATARLLLESEGFEVVGEAADGTTGLLAARELEPDLVLLDVQLPAVVITSSRDEADFGPLVSASGARGFIPKAELSGAALLALLEHA
jgi:CheY-like chemotaxis protein